MTYFLVKDNRIYKEASTDEPFSSDGIVQAYGKRWRLLRHSDNMPTFRMTGEKLVSGLYVYKDERLELILRSE